MPTLHRGAPRHVKLSRLSDHAFRVWVAGLCYCDDLLTDGVIDKRALDSIGVKVRASDTSELTAIVAPYAAALWEDRGDHFLMHDYLEWNESRLTVQRARMRLRERVKRFRDKRHGNAPSNATGNGVSNADSNPPCTEGNNDLRPLTNDHRPMTIDQGAPLPPMPTRAAPLGLRPRIDVAWPGRPNVPGPLHLEFISKLGGDAEVSERELRAWYPVVAAAFAFQVIGDDDWKFWRLRFREWVGTTAAPVEDPALARKLGPSRSPDDWYAACQHSPKCSTGPMHAQQMRIDQFKSATRTA